MHKDLIIKFSFKILKIFENVQPDLKSMLILSSFKILKIFENVQPDKFFTVVADLF